MVVRLPNRFEQMYGEPTDLTRLMMSSDIRVSHELNQDPWHTLNKEDLRATLNMIRPVLTPDIIEHIIPAWTQDGKIVTVYQAHLDKEFRFCFPRLTPATWDDVNAEFGPTLVPFGMFPQSVLDNPAEIEILSERQNWKLCFESDNSEYHSGNEYALARFYGDYGIYPNFLRMFQHEEYPLNDNFYVSYHAQPWTYRAKAVLSNGWPVAKDCSYSSLGHYWLRVEPIMWRRLPGDYWISQKGLMSCIQEKKADGYLNDIFWPQILQHQRKLEY